MEFTAKLNYVRVSPQKARLVLELIKGRRVEEALDTLRYTKKGIAPAIYKLLRSAVEKHAIANDGPRMKRVRPAPMGRAYRYQRRISHLNIVLAEKAGDRSKAAAQVVTDEKAAAPKKTAKKASAKKAAAKKTAPKKPAPKKAAKK